MINVPTSDLVVNEVFVRLSGLRNWETIDLRDLHEYGDSATLPPEEDAVSIEAVLTLRAMFAKESPDLRAMLEFPSQLPARCVFHRTPPQVSIALIEVSIKRGYLQFGHKRSVRIVTRTAHTAIPSR